MRMKTILVGMPIVPRHVDISLAVAFDMADFSQCLVGITKGEITELQRVLEEEYGIVPSKEMVKEYQLRPFSEDCLIMVSKPRKEKLHVPKSIGNVQNRILGKRRK